MGLKVTYFWFQDYNYLYLKRLSDTFSSVGGNYFIVFICVG